MSFLTELKRRNVFKVSVAYVVVAWLLAQVADLMLENFGAPDWVMKTFLGFLIIGFPLAVFFAWAFEMTPEGVKRESQVDRSQSITAQTGQKLNHAIMVVMALALVWFAWDRFGTAPPGHEPVAFEQASKTEKTAGQATVSKSVAVLPFVAMSSGQDDEYFADGLTEEILNALAQLPELLVTARTSAFHFKGQDIPVQEIAATLGVRHIVEGSVRRSGERLRVTAQLIRAADGFHLWSENYDSSSADTIEVQEDIAEKIAVAMDIVMNDEKREAMRKAGLKDVEAFIAFQKAVELYESAHGETDQIASLRQANLLFEDVLDKVPGYAPAYIEHSDVFVHILFNTVTGQSMNNVTDEDVAPALENAIRDMSLAAQNARNFQERNNIDFDLAYMTGNWRGMVERLERYLNESGCLRATWTPAFTLPFGYADQYLQRTTEFRHCDPMSSSAWFNETRAALWSGDAGSAVDTGQAGMESAPGNWLSHILISSLVAAEKYEEANSAISLYLQANDEVLVSRLLIAAARGDQETATALLHEYEKDPLMNDLWLLNSYAWVGDRENANRIAAAMDAQVFGPQSLIMLISWCSCGAPFDLSATPNFAAMFEETGLAWPPVSPIHFPLKDW